MPTWDTDRARLEIAYAVGEGLDVVEYVRQQKRAEGRVR